MISPSKSTSGATILTKVEVANGYERVISVKKNKDGSIKQAFALIREPSNFSPSIVQNQNNCSGISPEESAIQSDITDRSNFDGINQMEENFQPHCIKRNGVEIHLKKANNFESYSESELESSFEAPYISEGLIKEADEQFAQLPQGSNCNATTCAIRNICQNSDKSGATNLSSHQNALGSNPASTPTDASQCMDGYNASYDLSYSSYTTPMRPRVHGRIQPRQFAYQSGSPTAQGSTLLGNESCSIPRSGNSNRFESMHLSTPSLIRSSLPASSLNSNMQKSNLLENALSNISRLRSLQSSHLNTSLDSRSLSPRSTFNSRVEEGILSENSSYNTPRYQDYLPNNLNSSYQSTKRLEDSILRTSNVSNSDSCHSNSSYGTIPKNSLLENSLYQTAEFESNFSNPGDSSYYSETSFEGAPCIGPFSRTNSSIQSNRNQSVSEFSSDGSSCNLSVAPMNLNPSNVNIPTSANIPQKSCLRKPPSSDDNSILEDLSFISILKISN